MCNWITVNFLLFFVHLAYMSQRVISPQHDKVYQLSMITLQLDNVLFCHDCFTKVVTRLNTSVSWIVWFVVRTQLLLFKGLKALVQY